MRTIKGRKKADRRLNGRHRPHFDRLECRLPLSGSGSSLTTGSSLVNGTSTRSSHSAIDSSLSIISTNPSTSSKLALSPSTLTVRFDRPLDDFSIGNGDFGLVQVGSDGTTKPLAVGATKLVEVLDPSDSTGSQIALTLAKPLIDGHYELLSLGDNQLQGIDGTSLANDGQDVVISDFTIGAESNGFSSAVDLGIPTSTDTIHSDVLNLAGDPSAVNYYKLTLAPGHHWRLGLEISTQADRGRLDSTLSLFDANGHLVATNSVGRADDPGDPYLFAGLAPGVYYVGVSAKGNVPGPTGVYGLSNTIIGSSASGQTGGPFQLHIVADVADQPTKVLGLRVDHADPLSSNPTGLTLQFDGSIQLSALTTSKQPAVTLVDQNGQDWPLIPTQYVEALGQLSFVLNQALPAGHYSVELTGQGGLVDLAGQTPVVDGLPPGVLGTFKVAPTTKAPGDLGPILPSVAISGLDANLVVSPLSTLSRPFVIVVPGVYSLRGVNATKGVTFSLTDARSNVIANSSNATKEGSADVYLTSGSYTLTLANANALPSDVAITILERGILFSQLLDGGVGQGPAFNLRLVTPMTNFGQTTDLFSGPIASDSPTTTRVSTATQPTSPSTNRAPVGTESSSPSTSLLPSGGDTQAGAVGPISGGTTSAGSARDGFSTPTLAIGTATPVGPSSAFLLYNVGPVGRPSSQFNQISVVGPAGRSESVALASNVGGLASGLAVVPVEISPGGDLEPEATPLDPEIRVEGIATLQKGSTLESGLLARSPGSRKEDDLSLAKADWLGRVVSAAVGWFGPIEVAEPALEPNIPATASVQSSEVAPEIPEEHRVETASLASPVGIGILAMIAFRYRRRRLAPARKPQAGETDGKRRSILAGPHRRGRVFAGK